MRISYGGGGYSGAGGGMDSMGGMGAEAELSMLDKLLAGLPPWAVALVTVLAVLAAAWVAGAVLGKLYAMIRYPDPEKQSVIHPVIKVGFICTLAACCVWLYSSLTRQPEIDLPVDGEGVTDGAPADTVPDDAPSVDGGAGSVIGGGVAIMPRGEVAVAVPMG